MATPAVVIMERRRRGLAAGTVAENVDGDSSFMYFLPKWIWYRWFAADP